jgi:hypothetical protein
MVDQELDEKFQDLSPAQRCALVDLGDNGGYYGYLGLSKATVRVLEQRRLVRRDPASLTWIARTRLGNQVRERLMSCQKCGQPHFPQELHVSEDDLVRCPRCRKGE